MQNENAEQSFSVKLLLMKMFFEGTREELITKV
jgi:hypothetical protein